MTMDALDLHIIREMEIRPYGAHPKDPEALKPSQIARTLGVTAETIKTRLARMEEAGAILGYEIYPNMTHLGLVAGGFQFMVEDDDQKSKAIKDIESVERLMEIHNFLGPVMCIDIAFSGPANLERKLKLLSRLTGDDNPEQLYDRPMPDVTRALTNLDWRIIQALRGNARRPLNDVASDLGVTGKTVRRHYQRMAEEGSFFSIPRVNAGAVSGLIPFMLMFDTGKDPTPTTVNIVRDAFADRLVAFYIPVTEDLGGINVMLFANSPAEIEQMREEGAALEGVRKATPFVFRGFAEYSEWISDAIAEKVAATTA